MVLWLIVDCYSIFIEPNCQQLFSALFAIHTVHLQFKLSLSIYYASPNHTPVSGGRSGKATTEP